MKDGIIRTLFSMLESRLYKFVDWPKFDRSITGYLPSFSCSNNYSIISSLIIRTTGYILELYRGYLKIVY